MNCPSCDKANFDNKHCGFCGCRALRNPESGHIIYMIRGRVIAAPDDLKDQQAKHDKRYGLAAPDGLGPDPMDLRDERKE